MTPAHSTSTGRTPDTGPWRLPTATAEYVVAPSASGTGLGLVHWGAPGATWGHVAVEQTNVLTPTDVEPSEWTALGTRHVQRAELVADLGDGLVGVLLRLGPVRVERPGDGPGRHTLIARLTDTTGTLAVDLVVTTDERHDVVRKHVVVENTSATRTVRLGRVFSGAWDVPVGPGADVDLLTGAWADELTRTRAALPAGELSIGSRNGLTGHLYAPCVVVQRFGAAPDADEAFGVKLAWSGSWRMSVDAVPTRGRVRVSGGVDDESTLVTLEPGQRFVAPDMLGTWSPDGVAGVTRRWHAFQRLEVLRTTGPEHRPVVYNSWYATAWDVRVEHQARLAAVAADLGAECFVVDDGWFAGRTNDHAGIGDWRPDPVKFPAGLGPLIDAVHPRMRFGLWVEPECVSPDSDLYRAHPDWVYRAGDRPLVSVRHQYVLDLGRPEVAAHVAGVLRDLLQEKRITFLKWDMNRPVTDGGRPGDPHGREWSVQHTRAYYGLLGMVRAEFPHVTVESCASGAGRLDDATLALTDVTWASDHTAPRARLAVQHGFLTAYPAAAMSSWVTSWDDHGEGCSLDFRFVVAMAGALGIGVDLLAWDGATRSRATALVALYKEIRACVHEGAVTAHGHPDDARYALTFVAPDAARVVVLAYARPSAGRADLVVRVPGLDPAARYRLANRGTTLLPTGAAADPAPPRGGLFGRRRDPAPTDAAVLSGRDLAAGFVVPWALARDADVVVLDRC
ncbi:alpha-galactosidase [Kineosporia sp. A_224]|uniref:alpha-galactosidase n=1 Tax=Kineosporia sp. A_224 TaxID=1962180 RepID=UPI000B4AB1A0|nr:alpha-galactosidase [Kineosporia sp. A_224]